MTDLEKLNDTLDYLLIQKLELMDEIIKTKKLLEEKMKDGFYQLGKTRYVLGSRVVSAIGIPSEGNIRAMSRVIRGEALSSLCSITYSAFDFVRLPLPESESSETDKCSQDPSSSDCSPDGGGACDPTEDTKLRRAVDPISWFSALPPQSLRQAQANFLSALSLVAKYASLQDQLRNVLVKYSELKSEQLSKCVSEE